MAQYLYARMHTCFTRDPEVTLTLEQAGCATELAKTDAGLQTRDIDTVQTQEIAQHIQVSQVHLTRMTGAIRHGTFRPGLCQIMKCQLAVLIHCWSSSCLRSIR